MNQVVVPSVIGLPAATAEAILRAAGLRMSPTAPWGSVKAIRSQAPPAGVVQTVGSPIFVVFDS